MSYWKRVVMRRLNGSYPETKEEPPRERIVRIAQHALTRVFDPELSRVLLEVGPVVHAEQIGQGWCFLRTSGRITRKIPAKYSVFIQPWVFWISLLVRLDSLIQCYRRACHTDKLFEDDFFIYKEITFVECLLEAKPSGDIRPQLVEDLTVDTSHELPDGPLSILSGVQPGELQQDRATTSSDVRPGFQLGVSDRDLPQGFIPEEISSQHLQ